MRTFLGCALLFFFMTPAIGVSAESGALPPGQLFSEANQKYQQGNFSAAEQAYAKLLQSGFDSGTLYYNLGNACFKQRKLGEAIYYWEKARQKMPGDRDVQQNLELANLMVIDRVEVPSSPLPIRILVRFVHLFTVGQETWLVLGLFVAANLAWAISLLSRKPRVAFRSAVAGLVAFALFVVFGASLAWKVYDAGHRKEAVVVESKADVRSGPGTENVTVFVVHEGIMVQVHGAAEGWFQVSLPNGWNGWLPASSVRIL